MIQDSTYEEYENDEKNNLTINNFLQPGEVFGISASLLRDTIVRVQNDSENESGSLLVKGFNKNFKKTIKASSSIEFRISGTLMTDQFINVGNTRLIISTDSAEYVSISNNCKLN